MPGIRFAHLFGLSDALSSSFRDDGKVDAATRGMTLRPDLNGTTPKTALLPENVHFEGPFNASSSSGWDLVTISTAYGRTAATGARVSRSKSIASIRSSPGCTRTTPFSVERLADQ